jgi:hypothetical protein
VAQEQSHSLDPFAIEFPTDRITIREIRVADAAFAGPEGLSGRLATDIEAIAAHRTELELAVRAFEGAGRKGGQPPRHTREELVQDLDAAYRRYGLSQGLHQTRAMVRRFEAQAVAQAEGFRRGPGRPRG